MRTEEHKRKLSEANKGKHPINYGFKKGNKLWDNEKSKSAQFKKGDTIRKGTKLPEKQKKEHSDFMKEFYKTHKHPMIGKKSSEETKKKLRESHKGQIAWNRGLTKETDKRLDFKRRYNFKKGKDNPNYGRKTPIVVGDKQWNWKGGITPLVIKIRNSIQYKEWRSKIFERDNWTCQTCDKRGGLEAHHSLKTFSQIMEEKNIKTFEQALSCRELWDLNNGVTLCIDCHQLTKQGRILKNGNNKR